MKAIKTEIKIVSADACRKIGITIEHTRLAEWCAQLLLLREGTLAKISISDDKSAVALHFSLNAEAQGRAFFQCSAKEISVLLSKDELEYWCTFFSTAYVRERADVDHIDVEGSADGKEVELTFKFDRYQPPVTAEQAKWRLKDI